MPAKAKPPQRIPRRGVHIKLPEPLFIALRDRAINECESMQRIALDALRKHLQHGEARL